MKHRYVVCVLILSLIASGCISACQNAAVSKDVGIDIAKVKAKIEQNQEFYTEHFLRYGKAPSPPIYFGLADITNDGKPELLIGAVDIMSVNAYYSTYNLDLEALDVGEPVGKYQDVPTSHFFMQTVDQDLFRSLQFHQEDNDSVRFVATATKGGIPAECKYTVIEYSNHTFTTRVLEWSTDDITKTPAFSKSKPLPAVQVEIDPENIENSIKECIEQYESLCECTN